MKLKKDYFWLGVGSLALILTVLLLNWHLLWRHDWNARASFGDMFGVGNAILAHV